MKVSIE